MGHIEPDGQPRKMLDTSKSLVEFGFKAMVEMLMRTTIAITIKSTQDIFR